MTKNNIMIFTAILVLVSANAVAQDEFITLQECIELSHTNNPDVVNAALDRRAARAQKQEVFANWFPTVSATAGGFQAMDPLVRIGLDDVLGNTDAANNLRYYAGTVAGLNGIDTDWNFLGRGYIAALNVQQPVFAGGRIVNGNALAALGEKAADVKNDIAIRDNDDNVSKKYWTVVSLCEKKKALQQGLDLVESLEKDVEEAVAAGLAKHSDLLQVKLQANELRTLMKRLKSGERLAKMDLFNCIGLEYSIIELDRLALSDSLYGLPAPEQYYQDAESVASSMGENKLLELSVESKILEKKLALGETLPQVAVGASIGYGQTIGLPGSNALVYAVVKIPISDWAKTSHKVQRSLIELEKAQNDKDYLERQIQLKVEMDWINVQNGWSRMMDADQAVILSELLEKQKRDDYEAGLCTMTELLKSQSDLQNSRSAYVDSAIEYVSAVALWNRDRSAL